MNFNKLALRLSIGLPHAQPDEKHSVRVRIYTDKVGSPEAIAFFLNILGIHIGLHQKIVEAHLTCPQIDITSDQPWVELISPSGNTGVL